MLLALALLAAAPAAPAPPLPTPRSVPPRSGSGRPWWRCGATSTPTPSCATARSAPAASSPSACAASGLEVRHPVAKTGVVGDPPRRAARAGRRPARRHRRPADRGDERPRLPQPGEGRHARLRPRRPHRDPARRGRGAGRPQARLPGTVVFLFQPAEEGAPEGEEGGAPLMVKEGALDDPKVEAVFGLHVGSWVSVGQAGLDGRADLRLQRHLHGSRSRARPSTARSPTWASTPSRSRPRSCRPSSSSSPARSTAGSPASSPSAASRAAPASTSSPTG